MVLPLAPPLEKSGLLLKFFVQVLLWEVVGEVEGPSVAAEVVMAISSPSEGFLLLAHGLLGCCQETRTPVTFFLFLFTMNALLPLPLTTFPFAYCLIDSILPPPLCSLWPVL